MKLRTIAVLVALSCMGCVGTQLRLPYSARWRAVANSSCIVIGTIRSPTKEILSCTKSEDHKYVNIRVEVEECVKGVSAEIIQVQYHTSPDSYSPHPETVMKLDKKKGLLFLVRGNGDAPRQYFLVDKNSLQVLDVKMVAQIEKEVAEQARIIQNFNKLFPAEQEQLYGTVKAIIDDIVDSEMSRSPKGRWRDLNEDERDAVDEGQRKQKKKQNDAFLKLEKLGREAVPSIIMLMNDRRPLPIHCIDLKDPPGSWEGYRSYGPELVVDALHCILNQITYESYGSDIYNGGSEEQRRHAVNAWRIYLYHLKQNTYNKSIQRTRNKSRR